MGHKIRDKIGKIPEINSSEDALREILIITRDTRTHVLLQDALDWEELKLKTIAKIARKGVENKTVEREHLKEARKDAKLLDWLDTLLLPGEGYAVHLSGFCWTAFKRPVAEGGQPIRVALRQAKDDGEGEKT